MAKLYEYQSKKLLAKEGIKVPKGRIANNPSDVEEIARELGGTTVLKAQTWTTGRMAQGGVLFATSPSEASKISKSIFGKKIGGFETKKILVEEKIPCIRELFAAIILDDTIPSPVLIIKSQGGSGIEDMVLLENQQIMKFPFTVNRGIREYEARDIGRKLGLEGKILMGFAAFIYNLYKVSRRYEARFVEINPIIISKDNQLYAADCRMAIDDYAVPRHPELGIQFARELSRPPNELEIIAYKVEENDYRGTFYFFQMESEPKHPYYVAFHGRGGGGSIMAFDILKLCGLEPGNYSDTSGNPPASKTYKAARIILSQPGLKGYFLSGGGASSQEEYHTARGLVKAFREVKIEIPAVIHIRGNAEEEAKDILRRYTADLPGTVEAYGSEKDGEFCARRLKELIDQQKRISG